MSDLKTKQYKLRKQMSDEIEQATGIAMPVFGFDGFDMHNGRMGFEKHHRGPRSSGDCRGFNF